MKVLEIIIFGLPVICYVTGPLSSSFLWISQSNKVPRQAGTELILRICFFDTN